MDNLDKAQVAADIASQAAQGVSQSGIESEKNVVITQKVSLGFSIVSGFLGAFKAAKALFSKK